MSSDAPGVVDVVAFFRQRLHQANVLIEPVASLIVVAVHPLSAIIVTSVLHENSNRLPVRFTYQLRIHVSASEIYKASDDTQHFSKIIRALPRDCPCSDRTGTRAT